MIVTPLKVKYFGEDSGFCPYKTWYAGLKDRQTRAIIQSRLTRVQSGNLGEHKVLENADGVWELKFRHGSAIRIYFGKVGREIIILLCGGDKGSQDADIQLAKKYWKEARKAYG